MNLLTEAKKAVVIKNTHLYEAMITLYLGDWFNPKDKKSIIYRVFNTNDKERYAYFCEKYALQIRENKAGFHDIDLTCNYIVSGSGSLSVDLTISKLPEDIIKQITRDQGSYYFDNKKRGNPVFTIKIEIFTNNCNVSNPLYYIISTAKIAPNSYPDYKLLINGAVTNGVFNGGPANVKSKKEISQTGETMTLTTVFDIKQAIARQYNRGYVSLDPDGDSRYFEFPYDGGYLYIENLLEELNRLFPFQQHIVYPSTIISFKRQSNMTYIGNLNTAISALNDNKTTVYRSESVRQKLRRDQERFLYQGRCYLYHEENNVIRDIITLSGISQISVTVALTPSVAIGERVILISKINDYNKMYNSIYFIQSFSHHFNARMHDNSSGTTNLILCRFPTTVGLGYSQ